MHISGNRLLKKHFMPLVYGLILICLILCAGCSKDVRTEIALPPVSLMEPITIPDRTQAKTQGDLVRLLIEDEATMERKNADLAAIRRWRAVMEAGAND